MTDEFVIDPSLLSLDEANGHPAPNASSSSASRTGHDTSRPQAGLSTTTAPLDTVAAGPGEAEDEGARDDPDAGLYDQLSGFPNLGSLGISGLGDGGEYVDLDDADYTGDGVLGTAGQGLHGIPGMGDWLGAGNNDDDEEGEGDDGGDSGEGEGAGPSGRRKTSKRSTRGGGRGRGRVGRGRSGWPGGRRGKGAGREDDEDDAEESGEGGSDGEGDEEEDAADAEVLRDLARQGRVKASDVSRNREKSHRGTTGRKTRTKKKHQPTHEVRLIYASAMESYMAGDLDVAIERLEEVLRLDQMFGEAWATLASCYEETGPPDKARVMRFGALHFEGEADDWKELAFSFREDEMYDEAIHCLRKALKSDNGDVVAYWELADIYKARNNPAQALQSLGRILKLDPVSAHDFTLLADFVPLYRTTKAQKQNGIKALRVAWQYHLDTFDGPRDTGVVAPGDLAAAAGEGEGADGMASDGGDGDEDDDEGGGDDDEEGDQTGARPTPQRPNNTMRMDHVLTFVDLLLEMDQLEEALDVIKRGQRWLQGRYRQAAGQWEGTEMEDDREYDPPGFERPGVEADDRSGKGKGKGRKKKGKSAKKEHGGDEQEDDEDGEDEEEGEEGRVKRWPLMPNFRHRLALIRLRLGHVEEANIHANCVLELDEERWQHIYVELGDELVKHQNWHMGARLFGKLNDNDNIEDSADTIFKLGMCMHELYKQDPQHADGRNRRDIAQGALEWVIQAEPSNMQARLRLANLYDDLGKRAEALEIVREVMRYAAANDTEPRRGAAERRSRATMNVDLLSMSGPGIGSVGTRAERTAQARLNKSVYQDQMRQSMQDMLGQAKEAEEQMGQGSMASLEEFMMVAGNMIETFRLAGRNFGKNRGVTRVKVNVRKKQGQGNALADEAGDLQDRLRMELGIENEAPEAEDQSDDLNPTTITKRQTDFYGIGAEDWLGLIIKYCVILSMKNESRLALEILEHTIWANIFFNYRSEVAFRITIIACALRARHYPRIVQNCRRLTQMHQFSLQPFQIMLACLQGGGLKANNAYQVHGLQKFILREMRIYEAVAEGKRFHYSIKDRRWAQEKQQGLSENLGDEIESEDDFDEDDEPDDGEDEDTGTGNGTGASKGQGTGTAKGKGKNGDTAWQRGKRYTIGYGDGQDVDLDDPEQEARNRQQAVLGLPGDDGEVGMGEEGDSDLTGPIPVKPTMDSPMWNFMYGQLMLTARSHHTSLFYLIRAYELAPNDPLLCLLIAQAFFTRSQNRQADNRNQATAQGLAFLQRYRKLSPQDAESVEEVEYNFARSFHGLGIPHLAAKHYELVLDSVQRRMDEAKSGGGEGEMDVDDDARASVDGDGLEPDEAVRRNSLAYEAAFNLMLIYGASESTELVRAKSKWLAI